MDLNRRRQAVLLMPSWSLFSCIIFYPKASQGFFLAVFNILIWILTLLHRSFKLSWCRVLFCLVFKSEITILFLHFAFVVYLWFWKNTPYIFMLQWKMITHLSLPSVCGSSNENGSHSLLCLNIWSLVSGTIKEDQKVWHCLKSVTRGRTSGFKSSCHPQVSASVFCSWIRYVSSQTLL